MFNKIANIFVEMRSRSKEGHLSFFLQLQEMAGLWWQNRIGPGFYMKARLWRRDLSLQDKIQFVSEGIYWKEMQQRNPPAYHMILFNKSVEKSIWTAFGIPTPKFWGVFHPLRGRGTDGSPLRTAEDLSQLIIQHNLSRLCFKNMEDYGGRGFVGFECRHRAEKVQCRHFGIADWQDIQEFCDQYVAKDAKEGVLLEEYLEQHEWYRDLNPSSVNTMRIYVVWYDDREEPEVVGGLFRMGRQGAAIDNVDGGGIYAPIDVSSGRLGSTLLKSTHCEPQNPRHPDSGILIEGAVLPQWQEAKALVLDAMRCIPAMKAIGFDVAVTPDGPVLLEANERSGYPAQWAIGLPPGKFSRSRSV